ncbi:MAG: PQQ-binding-like beta-propeller repeat protein [Oligoflexia bacterium]|nr:PQQ-binding-like beta-propeller repeat protein [Oligoflexia bacterium]
MKRRQSVFTKASRLKLAVSLFLALALVNCSTIEHAQKTELERQWVRSTLGAENYGFRHSERTAPLIENQTIYQGNGLDGVVAFSQENGRVKWRFDVKNGVESGFGIDDKALYFGASDGNFYSINKFSGKIIWSFPTRTENLGTPLIHQGVVYFISGNNVLYALDSKTGKQLWIYNRGDASSLSIRGATKPAAYKNHIYAGFSDGYLVALSINDGSLSWERKLSNNIKFVDVDASPVVEEDLIWSASYDGSLYCLSRIDGQVQWRYDEGSSVAVTIDKDNLYFASLNNNITLLNKKNGNLIWKYNFDEEKGIPTQVVLHKNLALFGQSGGALIALNQKDGKKLAYYIPGQGISATPAVDQARSNVYIFTNQANLHKLSIK